MKFYRHLLLASSVALLCDAPRPAVADSFAEVAVGMAQPLGEDDYDNIVDTSLDLGLRFGTGVQRARRRPPLGFDVELGWSPVTLETDGLFVPGTGVGADFSAHRFRMMAGARLGFRVGRDLTIAARLAGGAEYVSINTRIDLIDVDRTETSWGLVIQPAVLAALRLGDLSLGGELALPTAWHSEDNNDSNIDYRSTDLRLAVVVGSSF